MEERKLVAVGDPKCGKTCLLIRGSKEDFPTDYIPTVFDNYNTEISVGKKLINLFLVDTATTDDYDKLRPLSYARTDIFLVCFAIDEPTSLTSVVEKWLPELRAHSSPKPILLVGNKKDVRAETGSDATIVTEQEARAMAEKVGADGYMECSALTGEGVTEVLEAAARIAHQRAKNPKKGWKFAT